MVRIGIRGETLHEQYIEAKSSNESLIAMPLPDERSRSIILVQAKHAPALWESLAIHALAIGSESWSLYDIQAGLAWIGRTGAEEFLPQSLNLDLTGALSFDNHRAYAFSWQTQTTTLNRQRLNQDSACSQH